MVQNFWFFRFPAATGCGDAAFRRRAGIARHTLPPHVEGCSPQILHLPASCSAAHEVSSGVPVSLSGQWIREIKSISVFETAQSFRLEPNDLAAGRCVFEPRASAFGGDNDDARSPLITSLPKISSTGVSQPVNGRNPSHPVRLNGAWLRSVFITLRPPADFHCPPAAHALKPTVVGFLWPAAAPGDCFQRVIVSFARFPPSPHLSFCVLPCFPSILFLNLTRLIQHFY